MRTVYLPAGTIIAGVKQVHGKMIKYPESAHDDTKTVEQIIQNLYIILFQHGKGDKEDGLGSLTELKQYESHPMFSYFYDMVDKRNDTALCMIQTMSGYTKGEPREALDYLKNVVRSKYKPFWWGFSWGHYGIEYNINNGLVDPEEVSNIVGMSTGHSGVNNYPAKFTNKHVPVLLFHNVNDTIADDNNSQVVFDALKSINAPVALVKYQNVWTSSDGTKTSHATVGFVFPSHLWTAFTTDKAAIAAKSFAAVQINNLEIKKNVYQWCVDNAELRENVVADILLYESTISIGVQVWKRADGSTYIKNV